MATIKETKLTTNTRLEAITHVANGVYAFKVVRAEDAIDVTISATLTTNTYDLMQELESLVNNDPVLSVIVEAKYVSYDDGSGSMTAYLDIISTFESYTYILTTLDEGTEERLGVRYFVPQVPYWATDDTALIAEPSVSKKEIGWELITGNEGERPPLEYFNWFWNTVGNWFIFLKDLGERMSLLDSSINDKLAHTPYMFPVKVTVGWFLLDGNYIVDYNSIPIYTDGGIVDAEIKVNPQPIGNDTALTITLAVPPTFSPVTPPVPVGFYTPCIYYCNPDGSPIGNGALPLWPSDETDSIGVNNTNFNNVRSMLVYDDMRWPGDAVNAMHNARMNHGRVVIKQQKYSEPHNILIEVRDTFPEWDGEDNSGDTTSPTLYGVHDLSWGIPASIPHVPIP